ncbi:GTP pyrophosphokinase [Gracilibacillus salinarum]|uniref:GTP pyrophosphokinase family protein n=1 Tax=Gracilibacillus salinarum TaxID=2932255 RepID=A0ABY4GLA5_9BACI|nr:GTP pyrophosphokinase family protein [Gracilibacillus salinarum]UOQ84989.1 GTP pyrophosphokinase family protein [Gracilibacillus salinarum]
METQLYQLRAELIRFMMAYKFALEEVNTKINILQQEFQYMHDYNPIEHVKSRVKSPESILKKIRKKEIPLSMPEIQDNIRDIAGIRINCSFTKDIYRISQMLEDQKDITVIQKKDYIVNPKPNGYRSLHLIIQIPIFMSDRVKNVFVEIQIRTIAMDFWASLEHKIYYKYNKDIPERLKAELADAASSATELDREMESIHQEINEIKQQTGPLSDQDEEMIFPIDLLREIVDNK